MFCIFSIVYFLAPKKLLNNCTIFAVNGEADQVDFIDSSVTEEEEEEYYKKSITTSPVQDIHRPFTMLSLNPVLFMYLRTGKIFFHHLFFRSRRCQLCPRTRNQLNPGGCTIRNIILNSKKINRHWLLMGLSYRSL